MVLGKDGFNQEIGALTGPDQPAWKTTLITKLTMRAYGFTSSNFTQWIGESESDALCPGHDPAPTPPVIQEPWDVGKAA